MKIGDRVIYVGADSEDEKKSGYYPPVGTAGTVVDKDETGIRVKWDNGTKGSGEWWCNPEDVVSDEQYYDALVDKIARFFEEYEINWYALKNCWLENGRSNGLRKLLQKAMKMTILIGGK